MYAKTFSTTLLAAVTCWLLSHPILAAAAAGQVEFVSGTVSVISPDGMARPATKGMEFESGATLQTGDGLLQVKFTDGGWVSLPSNSALCASMNTLTAASLTARSAPCSAG